MQCKQCENDLMIGESKLVSDVGTTEVFSEMKMVCINPKCPNFGGYDLNKAEKFETVRNQV